MIRLFESSHESFNDNISAFDEAALMLDINEILCESGMNFIAEAKSEAGGKIKSVIDGIIEYFKVTFPNNVRKLFDAMKEASFKAGFNKDKILDEISVIHGKIDNPNGLKIPCSYKRVIVILKNLGESFNKIGVEIKDTFINKKPFDDSFGSKDVTVENVFKNADIDCKTISEFKDYLYMNEDKINGQDVYEYFKKDGAELFKSRMLDSMRISFFEQYADFIDKDEYKFKADSIFKMFAGVIKEIQSVITTFIVSYNKDYIKLAIYLSRYAKRFKGTSVESTIAYDIDATLLSIDESYDSEIEYFNESISEKAGDIIGKIKKAIKALREKANDIMIAAEEKFFINDKSINKVLYGIKNDTFKADDKFEGLIKNASTAVFDIHPIILNLSLRSRLRSKDELEKIVSSNIYSLLSDDGNITTATEFCNKFLLKGRKEIDKYRMINYFKEDYKSRDLSELDKTLNIDQCIANTDDADELESKFNKKLEAAIIEIHQIMYNQIIKNHKEYVKLFVYALHHINKINKEGEKESSSEEGGYITPAFTDAVDEGNIRSVRIMMKDSLLVDPSFKQFEEMDRIASAKIKNLYDEDDGDYEHNGIDARDKENWNDKIMNGEMVRVVGNFSKERIALLKKIVTHHMSNQSKHESYFDDVYNVDSILEAWAENSSDIIIEEGFDFKKVADSIVEHLKKFRDSIVLRFKYFIAQIKKVNQDRISKFVNDNIKYFSKEKCYKVMASGKYVIPSCSYPIKYETSKPMSRLKDFTDAMVKGDITSFDVKANDYDSKTNLGISLGASFVYPEIVSKMVKNGVKAGDISKALRSYFSIRGACEAGDIRNYVTKGYEDDVEFAESESKRCIDMINKLIFATDQAESKKMLEKSDIVIIRKAVTDAISASNIFYPALLSGISVKMNLSFSLFKASLVKEDEKVNENYSDKESIDFIAESIAMDYDYDCIIEDYSFKYLKESSFESKPVSISPEIKKRFDNVKSLSTSNTKFEIPNRWFENPNPKVSIPPTDLGDKQLDSIESSAKTGKDLDSLLKELNTAVTELSNKQNESDIEAKFFINGNEVSIKDIETALELSLKLSSWISKKAESNAKDVEKLKEKIAGEKDANKFVSKFKKAKDTALNLIVKVNDKYRKMAAAAYMYIAKQDYDSKRESLSIDECNLIESEFIAFQEEYDINLTNY